MKRSTHRILTTHAGSLPRPAELLSLISAQEAGKPVDAAKLDTEVRSAVKKIVAKQADLGVDVLNDGEQSKPSYATYVKDRLSVHVCWGNWEIPRKNDVALRDIIDVVLRAKPAGIMLMASNGRHAHEWKVFEEVKLPEGKYLIPGVLDTTTNIIEHPEVVAQRLALYAGVVGKENVMAGTDCGFGTGAGMQRVVPSVVWAKLQAMAEGAALASKELW